MAVIDTPQSGAGATLAYKIGAASVFTVVALLVDMEEDGISTDDVETTLLSSTVKTFVPSIPDPGGVTFTVRNVPTDTTLSALRGLANAPQVVAWQIKYPDSTTGSGTTEDFSGYINSFAAKGFAIGESLTADISIKISGLIDVTPAT